MEQSLMIFVAYLIGAMLLGIACVIETIAFPSKRYADSKYYECSAVAERIGKVIKVIAIIIMVITAAFGFYYAATHDYNELVTLSIFIYFLLFLLGVNLGGHISCWLIKLIPNVDADTSLVDDMTSC